MGLAAAAAVAAAIIASLPSHAVSPKRAALTAYIKEIDGVQASMAYRMSRLSLALEHFTTSKTLTAADQRQLDAAATTLRRLRSRLAALSAPTDALELRTEMLALVSAEAEITSEVAAMARFAAPFEAALAPLHGAAATLARNLAAAKPPTPHVIRGTKKQIAAAQAAFTAASDRTAAAEAADVEGYDAVVAATLRRLRPLAPPPALRPAYRSQVDALHATDLAGRRLSAALLQPKRTDIAEIGRRFTLASRRAQTVSAQRAEIAAIAAYNARVRRVRALETDVQGELGRLSSAVK